MNKATVVYETLLEQFGPQHWWPAETPFEVIVGAILMPQTSWENVESAIVNLRRAGMLDPSEIATSRLDRLTRLVKPAGLFRSKPRRLRGFCRHLMESYGGDLDAFFDRDKESLREELLALEGIGPETADSILLYAANKSIFVVDAYTIRVGRRVGLFDYDSYDRVQEYFHTNLSSDVDFYQEYHALIVKLAKTTCRPRPNCTVCLLCRICDHARSKRVAPCNHPLP